MKVILSALLFIGCLLFVLGIYGFLESGKLVIAMIRSEMRLQNDTDTYKLWKDVPIPIYNRFYFFNITNAHEITAKGSKPILQEVGPFTYRLYINKTKVKFHHNDSITYYDRKTWFFVPELSVGDEQTTIITLNTPLAAALNFLHNAPFGIKEIITFTLDQITEGFFIKRTIGQLTFKGYKDPITSIGPLIDNRLKKLKGKFGYFTMYNGTKDGPFNVHNTPNALTLIHSYKYQTSLSTWSTSECNRINDSTTGELNPPLLGGQMRLKIFHSLLCRTLELNFNETYLNSNGLYLKRFTLNKNFFKNSTEYPPNACYDADKVNSNVGASERRSSGDNLLGLISSMFTGNQHAKKDYAIPSGVVDLGKCQFGAPVYISSPHFLNADPYFRSKVIGMQPNATKHEFLMDIEPYTGIAGNIAARIQMNVHINKPPGYSKFHNIPEIFFPVLWQDLTFDWTDELLSKIRLANRLPELVPKICLYFLTPFGVILIICFSCITNINKESNYFSDKEIDIAKSVIRDDKAKITFHNDFVYQKEVDTTDERARKV